MTKKIVLLIDTNESAMNTLAVEITNTLDMKVIKTTTGTNAFQMARNQKIDIIVMDYIVPKLAGNQLISSLRDTYGNEDLPILVHSEDYELAKKENRDVKFIQFLKKPAKSEQILKIIQQFSVLDKKKKKFRIDVDFINPFIDSSTATLDKLCSVKEITALTPYLLSKDEVLDIDISGTLAISSPYFRGSIAISFSDDVYKKMVEKMIEENVSEINLENQEGAAEIINIIYGQTKAVLNAQGFSLSRAIPSVMRGEKHKIYQDSKIPILLVPFNSKLGSFWIQICVKAI